MSDTYETPYVDEAPPPSSGNLEDAYAQWDKSHARMKSAPPAQGRDYIKHAANLLTLLEPVSEVNPFAKAVVASFKLVVLIEQDRRENDARVAAVILAQTEMMRVLLDIDKLTSRYANPNVLYTISSITNLFEEIQTELKSCQNCMDKYRKEHKMVKLYKAREWKEKLMQFVTTFDALRSRLLVALDLQTASNVSQLVIDMDKILTLLFAPQDNEEKDILKKIQVAGREKLKNDPKTLQKLLVATGDTWMAGETPAAPPPPEDDGEKKGKSSKPDAQKVANSNIEMQLKEIGEELRTSVDELCNKNMKYFERTLIFYGDQLKKNIDDSADRVISSLSGPYDRLKHKDLRELWKEMKWIFCVETRIFVLALFEYYQDLYTYPHVRASDPDDPGTVSVRNTAGAAPSSGSQVHPDAWTLPYLAFFTTAASSIDADNSGFIRISEANKFTSEIPQGWTLPQYCAYLVEGRHHENAIYRHRMIHMRNIAQEMQSQLLPRNRFPAASVMATICDEFIDKITLHPRNETKSMSMSIAPELHELIKNRILEQDKQARKAMKLFEYDLDESTIDMLFHGQDAEKYIFPLAYAMMELLLDFHHLCRSVTIDFREWTASIVQPFELLRDLVDNRMDSLRDQNRAIDFDVFYRGVFSWFTLPDASDMTEEQRHEMDGTAVYDIYRHRADMSFMGDFPLPNFKGDFASRTYPTWEDFSEQHDVSHINAPEDHFPIQWDTGDSGWAFVPNYLGFFSLPTSRYCNKCEGDSDEDEKAYFNCLECEDFDLCHTCYNGPPAEQTVGEHHYGHAMSLVAAYIQDSRRLWIRLQNERETERCHTIIQKVQNDHSLSSKSQPPDDDDEFGGVFSDEDEDADNSYAPAKIKRNAQSSPLDLDKEFLYVCSVCQSGITLQHRFYLCGEYTCRDVRPVCDECSLKKYDNVDSHFWWHSLLPFDKGVLKFGVDADSDDGTARGQGGALTQSRSLGPSDLTSMYDTQADKMFAQSAGMEVKIEGVEHQVSIVAEKVDDVQSQLHTFAQETSEGLARIESLDERIAGLEEQVSKSLAGLEAIVEERLPEGGQGGQHNEDLEGRIAALETSMTQRLSGLEAMMNQVLAALSGGSASRAPPPQRERAAPQAPQHHTYRQEDEEEEPDVAEYADEREEGYGDEEEYGGGQQHYQGGRQYGDDDY